MFRDTLSLNNSLVSLESVLKIEIDGEAKVKETVEDAIRRLENTYNCTLDKDVYTLQKENMLTEDKINLFLRDVKQVLADFSLYMNVCIYAKSMCITLSDVNYLGYDREELLTYLKYFQDEQQYKQYGPELVPVLYNVLNNIGICAVKRLFIVLLMLERLGITEGVAIISQFLYLGGLVV